MNGIYSQDRLKTLLRNIKNSGATPPDPSFVLIDYHQSWSAWRVQLPGLVGYGTRYFSFKAYGDPEAALIEAQYFRDDAFEKTGIDLYARSRTRFTKQEAGTTLCIHEGVDYRNGGRFIFGTWQETGRDGVSRQRRVSRTFGRLRTRDEAWSEVEHLVRHGMDQEAERCRRGHSTRL